MIHATRKSMEQLGDDKLEAGEKDRIESAIKDLEEAMKGEDKDRIEASPRPSATPPPRWPSASTPSRAAMQAARAPGGRRCRPAARRAAAAGGAADDVVDAEFEEVKDDKK
jgi:molecular chaperone DnaK